MRRLLKVSPAEVWLKNEHDDTAYFPLQNGSFELHFDITDHSTLIVEGPVLTGSLPPSRSSSSQSSVTVSSTPSIGHLPPPPKFRSVIAPNRGQTFSLKIVKAQLIKNGRQKPTLEPLSQTYIELEPLSQTYIELVESTANLDHILSIVHRRWGAEYKIVTNDGIELEGFPATQVTGNNMLVIITILLNCA